MVGSLIKMGGLIGIVIDARISREGELIHKIKWIPNKDWASLAETWINRKLFKPNDFKVLVKHDLYGEEQAGL
jgi:hypothetical protein